jgi:hypothetical protein
MRGQQLVADLHSPLSNGCSGMKFLDSESFAGSYRRENGSGEIPRIVRHGRGQVHEERPPSIVASQEGNRGVGILVAESSATDVSIFTAKPRCQTCRNPDLATMERVIAGLAIAEGKSGTPSGASFARGFAGMRHNDCPVISMVRLGKQTAGVIEPMQ